MLSTAFALLHLIRNALIRKNTLTLQIRAKRKK